MENYKQYWAQAEAVQKELEERSSSFQKDLAEWKDKVELTLQVHLIAHKVSVCYHSSHPSAIHTVPVLVFLAYCIHIHILCVRCEYVRTYVRMWMYNMYIRMYVDVQYACMYVCMYICIV